jgi:DNA-binding transcriptional regulator PaaX
VWLKDITAATGHSPQEVGSSLSKLMARGCVKAAKQGRANHYEWDDTGTEGRPYRLNK